MAYLRLDEVSRLGFSKTARSCPCHREADGHGDDRSALAVRRRCLADDVAEATAEGAETGEAHVQADVGHAPVGRAQQKHGALDSAALKVPVRRLAKGRSKGSDEVRLRDARDSSEGRDVEWLRIGAVHGVAGAEHPAIDLLDGAAHCVILCLTWGFPGSPPRRR